MKIRRPPPVERFRRTTTDEYPYGALDLPAPIPGSLVDADTLVETFVPRACPTDLDSWWDWTRPRAAAYLPLLRDVAYEIEVGRRVGIYDDRHPYDNPSAWSHREWILDREALAR